MYVVGEKMNNEQMVNMILTTLEKNHINLYHDVSREEISQHIENIKNINELSENQFDLEMLKLFSMFKDGHTCYNVKFIPLDKQLTFVQNKFYVLDNDKWRQISYFGNTKADKIPAKLTPLASFETKEWLNICIKQMINNGYIYELLNLNSKDKIELILSDNSKLELHKQDLTSEKIVENKIPYDFKVLDGNILYLKYKKCYDDKRYPFCDFVKDVAKTVDNNKITDYILDLRGNAGGSSEILNPFQNLVADKKMKGVLLIDNGVFSSGRIAVARFKRSFNTTLIGEPTGGASKSYGYTKPLAFNGKSFSASIRLWDFSDVFGYEGAIQPDILVKENINNIQNKEDVVLKTAVDYIAKSKTKDEKCNN